MKGVYLLGAGVSLFFVTVLTAFSIKNRYDVDPTPYPLEIPFNFGPGFKIPDDNPLTVEGIELGRMLFYEKKLSRDNTISCSTCHQQKLAFTDGKRFSTGIEGRVTPRSAMSLANLLWRFKFFWDGRVNTLEQQAMVPIQDSLEMHLSMTEAVRKLQATDNYPKLFGTAFGSEQITQENIAKALAQFQRILISSNSKYDKYLRGDVAFTPEEKLGMDLFMTHPIPENNLRGGNCGDCHGSFKTALHGIHNNGLDIEPRDKGRELVTNKKTDRGKFRAPSLRNIALTAPYMHDGRFSTLEQVLDHYNENIQSSPTLDPLIIEASNQIGGKSLLLTPTEKKAIIAFLHTLTDSTFVNDPRFSDPFKVLETNKRRKK